LRIPRNIFIFLKNVGILRIFLEPNGSISSSILCIWSREAGIFKRKTRDWTHMSFQFGITFGFTIEYPAQRVALFHIKDFISHFNPKDTTQKVVCSHHQPVKKLK